MNDLNISKNITRYRKSRRLTIKELANLIGVTPSLLSQIEKGSANPSINTLKQISKVLDIALFNFFINDNPTEGLIVRKNNRKKIIFNEDDSFTYELLTPSSKGEIEFMLMKIPPNTSSSKDLFNHKGEEVAYVIKGDVTLYFMDSVVKLNSGDSVKIPPNFMHRWENNGLDECEVIFAVTPYYF